MPVSFSELLDALTTRNTSRFPTSARSIRANRVMDFAREFLPDDFNEVRDIFSERGAYQKFKALLARRHALEQWHAFEKKETEQALRHWCEVNEIAVTD